MRVGNAHQKLQAQSDKAASMIRQNKEQNSPETVIKTSK